MSVTPSPSRATDPLELSPLRAVKLLTRLIIAAFGAAVIVGSVATAFQYVRVVPLILEAEAFERRRLQETNEEWAPAEGAERGLFSWLSNVLVAFAFAQLLLVFCALDHAHVSLRSGLQRGAVGWSVFMALPCVGLSPELPGMAAAELTDRQWWWLYAVLLAACGFTLIHTSARLVLKPPPLGFAKTAGELASLRAAHARYWSVQGTSLCVGAVLAAVPHITGAPHPHLHPSANVSTSTTCGAGHAACARRGPPSEMAAIFAVWCLATAFAYWLVLGAAVAAAYNLAMTFEEPLPSEVAVAA